ncbi:MAG: hypothetical protein ACRDFT_02320, partial [bacterium]
PSPIRGPKGNLEFFLLLDTDPRPAAKPIDVEGIVAEAHMQVPEGRHPGPVRASTRSARTDEIS